MKHWRFLSRLRIPRSWLLTFGLLGGLIFGVWGLAGLSSGGNWNFTNTDDATTQQRELLAYIEADQLPHRVVQVDLAQHPKISQFTDIDSSASG